MTEREVQAQEAAYLYAQGFSQQQLADFLECSQSNVSKLLRLAERAGWIKTTVRFDEGGVPQSRLNELRRLVGARELADRLKQIESPNRVHIRNIRVFPSGRGSLDERLVSFGRLAATRGIELIARSKVVGVSFGTSLHRFIDGFSWVPSRQERPITIVPMAGEVASYDRFGSSSTWLAHKLHEIVNGGEMPPKFSLATVPFFVPRTFDSTKRKALREYVGELRSYREVLSGEDALLPNLDCLFTSVGQQGNPLAAAGGELEEACGISLAALSKIVAADLGGTLIPRSGLGPADRRLYEDVVACMTGLSLKNIDSLARKADDHQIASARQKPGVCVVAMGENKARPLLVALEHGLVNELIIDHELAEALKQLLP